MRKLLLKKNNYNAADAFLVSFTLRALTTKYAPSSNPPQQP